MPSDFTNCRPRTRATVALSIYFFAALQHFAIAQTVAPEPDPFAASYPEPKSNSKFQPSAPVVEANKKLRAIAPTVVAGNPPTLSPLRVLQLGESKPGGPIASIPSDPYMTAEQEARIMAALQTHDDTDWDGISLIELKRILKSRLPIWINRSEISVVGMEMNDVLKNGGDVVAGSLGDRLKCLLKDTQLDFMIRANRLEITSLDDRDSLSNIRIYDVTPLVLRVRAGKRVFDFESLSNLIQLTLDPDSWLSAGGSNVISDFIVGEPGSERSLIVVSAPTSLQLQLQPLLDRLNISTANTVLKSQTSNLKY